MPSTFSPSLRIELPADGEQANFWGQTTNRNLGTLFEQAITGATTIDLTSSDATLTALNGVVDESRSAVLFFTGTAGAARTVTIPNLPKRYDVVNTCGQTVSVKTAGGVAYDIPDSATAYVYCDGANTILGRTITDGANALTSNPAPLNNTALTGAPTAPTAAAGTNTTQIATTQFVRTAATNALPIGAVIMWYRPLVEIPAGWQLCDGTNGTPNMLGMFPVGAGGGYALGATGGANSVTLDTTQIPSHAHSVSGTTGSNSVSHTHVVSGTTGGQSDNHTHAGSTGVNGNHTHTTPLTNGGALLYSGGGGNPGVLAAVSGGNTGQAGEHQHEVYLGGVSSDHSHSINVASGSESVPHTHVISTVTELTGGGLPHENRPPFYGIYFIAKVA